MKRIALALTLLLFLNSCAFDIVRVKQVPANIELKNDPNASFTLEREARVTLETGYSRTLEPNTNWSLVGTLPEGDVFKTRDQILTVEGSNIYEAYIVVESDKLTGFYLPAAEAYSPLKKPLFLSFSHKQ